MKISSVFNSLFVAALAFGAIKVALLALLTYWIAGWFVDDPLPGQLAWAMAIWWGAQSIHKALQLRKTLKQQQSMAEQAFSEAMQQHMPDNDEDIIEGEFRRTDSEPNNAPLEGEFIEHKPANNTDEDSRN